MTSVIPFQEKEFGFSFTLETQFTLHRVWAIIVFIKVHENVNKGEGLKTIHMP